MLNQIKQHGREIRKNKVYQYQDKIYKFHPINSRYGKNEYLMANQINKSNYKKYFVHYHNLFEDNGFYVIEMENCQGNLQDFQKSFLSQINPEEREYYIFQILKEILKAHKCLSKILERNFIFRDLTLNNLLYDSNRIKLCDFEMIRVFNQGEMLTQNFNQQYDYYLEDEQNQNYDQSIDIYSLGVCLYRLYRGSEMIVFEDGRMTLPLGIENQISLRLKYLLDSMLRTNSKERITWDQLFEHIYKETIRVLDITSTFQFDLSLKYKNFDFRFINQQLVKRDQAFDETQTQTRQNISINLFMDQWCHQINKIFLGLIENKNKENYNNYIYIHFRILMYRIEQLQNQMSKIQDEVDRFDLIEQLNQPTYLYRMFCELLSNFENETMRKLINNEDLIIDECYNSHKGEEAQYFNYLKMMKLLLK